MNFGMISFVYALPLAALPVIFHLLMKRRRKQLLFSTFLFFLKADPNIASRRRLKEILLMAVRILFLACLILALARPETGCHSSGQAPDVVAVLIDNSASMAMPAPDGRPKLDLAVDAARRLIERLPPGSAVALALLVDDPRVSLPEGLSPDLAALSEALAAITPTQAAGDPNAALRRAMRAVSKAPSTLAVRRALYVFSDFQRVEWPDNGFRKALPAWRVRPVFGRVPSLDLPPNAQIEVVDLPRQPVLPGRPCPVSLRIRNTAERPLALRVMTRDSEGRETARALTLAGGETRTDTWRVTPLGAGMHWLQATIEGDAFTADNRLCVALLARPPMTVLLVGAPDDFGTLPTAVAPAGDGRYTGLIPRFCTRDELAARLQEHRPLLLVCTWSDAEEAAATPADAATRDYVRRGGSVLYVPPVATRVATSRPPAWIGATPRPTRIEEDSVVDVLDRRSELWGPLRDASGMIPIRRFTTRRLYVLDAPSPWRPLLGRGFAEPVLVERAFGEGWVYASGLAFSPAWTSLATGPSGAGMILVHQMALRNPLPRTAAAIGLDAGAPLPDALAPGTTRQVTSLVGDPMNLAIPPGATVSLPRTGVFAVKGANHEFCVWVRPSALEGSQPFLPVDEVASLSDPAPRVIELPLQEQADEPLVRAQAGTVSLFFPLLLAVLAAWMVEGWLETSGRSHASVESKNGSDML